MELQLTSSTRHSWAQALPSLLIKSGISVKCATSMSWAPSPGENRKTLVNRL